MTMYNTRPVPNATPTVKQGVDVSKCGGEWHNTFAPRPVPAPFTTDTARRPGYRRIVDELLTGAGITCAAVLTGLTFLVIAGLAGWIG